MAQEYPSSESGKTLSWSDYLCEHFEDHGICCCQTLQAREYLLKWLRICNTPIDQRGEDEYVTTLKGELAIIILEAADLVEHGISHRWSWTTEDGAALLHKIDNHLPPGMKGAPDAGS